MDAYKINVKLFAATGTEVTSHDLVPVFHRWIQEHAIKDHLLIDVADYAHVIDGPGTVLVSREANFYFDRGGHRLGLLYSRKIPGKNLGVEPFVDRLRSAVFATIQAAVKLEQEPSLAGRLTFKTNELSIRLNDRLLAPNTPETLAEVRPVIETLSTDLFGGPCEITSPATSPGALFEISIKADQSPKLGALANRISALPV